MDLDKQNAAGWAETQAEEREVLLHGATECEWCGETLDEGEGNLNQDDEVLCDECNRKSGYADVDEPKAERRQMGLINF